MPNKIIQMRALTKEEYERKAINNELDENAVYVIIDTDEILPGRVEGWSPDEYIE